jgi:hypothetical protein
LAAAWYNAFCFVDCLLFAWSFASMITSTLFGSLSSVSLIQTFSVCFVHSDSSAIHRLRFTIWFNCCVALKSLDEK